MNKSKIPEYLIWGIYALLTAACMLTVAAALSMSLGFGFVPGTVGAVLIAVLLWLMVRGLHKFTQKEAFKKFFFDKHLLCLVAEGVAFVVMLAGMIVLRSSLTWEVTGNEVYEAAQVTEGKFYVAGAHGGYRVYLYLMNLALMLLGNRTFAAIILQLFLLVGAAVSLYLGVRKIAGTGAALLTTAFLGYAPYMVDKTCELNPFLVFLLCFGLALNCIGGISDSMLTTKHVIDQIVAALCYLVSGVLIGLCCYLDVAGITLLIVLTGVICFGDYMRLREDVYVDYPNWFSEVLGSPVAVFLSVVLIAVFSFWQFHGSFASLSAQLALYAPGSFEISSVAVDSQVYWEIVLVAVFLLFGVFSFWCSRQMGRRVVWLFSVILLTIMLCLGISAPDYFDGFAVLYILCVILAGSGLGDLLKATPEKVEKTEENAMRVTSVSAIIDMDAPEEPVAEPEKNTDMQPAIQFIENPLPLPKKHTRKTMDYDYEVADDDDFDIK